MASETLDSSCLPLQEKIVHNNKTARAIELLILSLLVTLLVYRLISFKDQDHYFPWLIALLCESWFTFVWVLEVSLKWNQCSTRTYPERLVKRVCESDFPPVDIFVTTADPILEPSIITMNTVLSLLAVDYPVNKLALYLSDDGCSPLTFYSLVETTKFAKLWVPFCKKYNVQVRAPFRYFTPESMPLDDDSMEFQQEWKKMKNEYGDLLKKIYLAAQKPFPCDSNSDFGVFYGVHRSDHPAIIKVVSENKEGTLSDLPHVIYISREKSPKHQHHYKAGAMNVLSNEKTIGGDPHHHLHSVTIITIVAPSPSPSPASRRRDHRRHTVTFTITVVVSDSETSGYVMNLQPSEAQAGFDIRVPPIADQASLERRIAEEWTPASRNMTFEKVSVYDENGKPILTAHDSSNPWFSLSLRELYMG